MPDPPFFNPPGYLRNGHLQTLLNSFGPRSWRARALLQDLSGESRTLAAEDGTRLLAEFDRAADERAKLVVLLHGWEGCSQSSYIVSAAAGLLEQGFDVLRVNLRDHGPSHHLNPGLFNSTLSPEVASAIEGFVAAHRYQRVFLAGFSLGASFALRIAADRGRELGLDAVIAVCPPVDPAHAMQALNQGFFVYEKYFFRRWRGSLRRKLHCFPDLGYGAELATARSLDDLNRIFIPRFTEFERVEDYFSAYALVGNRLAGMAMPAYLIATEDDPIIPLTDLPRIDHNEKLHIETCRYGGHCGFIENLGAHSWLERRMLQILQGFS